MAEVTIANIFTSVSDVVGGIVDGGLTFVSSLWANPMGKIIIATGLAGTVIGFGRSLFLKKKHV